MSSIHGGDTTPLGRFVRPLAAKASPMKEQILNMPEWMYKYIPEMMYGFSDPDQEWTFSHPSHIIEYSEKNIATTHFLFLIVVKIEFLEILKPTQCLK